MTAQKPKTFGPYSPIRRVGDLYFTAGQVGADPETKTAEPDIRAQTIKALENLKEVLASEGLELSDVVKVTVFLTDLDDAPVFGEVYAQYFSEPLPARTTVCVKELPRVANNPLKIEIEAIAARKENHD